jgi:hypothetical protein
MAGLDPAIHVDPRVEPGITVFEVRESSSCVIE